MKKEISAKDQSKLLFNLEKRFEKNMARHKMITWEEVLTRLTGNSGKLWSLFQMEETGGEPDVVGVDKKTGEFIFIDCSAESPPGRRSCCYDKAALDARKEHKPKSSAVEAAASMGARLLTEVEYRGLQVLGIFDAKTSSWVQTPVEIRELGGALFCDRRFNQVFVYHNGAESYYAARGFRASLRV
ncbi:MAG TPA: DUF4256 domain-containing protein [Bacteroidia bacterium]|nr:DUF4256 domain-containing protein [Bacteroidia bacterium]